MDAPSFMQGPNDNYLIDKLVKLTESVKTYSSRGQVKQKDTGAQSRHQLHNDVQDLQMIFEGPAQPLNEAAKVPAAALGLRYTAQHLGQALPYEEEND